VEKILTKEEIAELLSAVRHGEIEIDAATEDEPGSPGATAAVRAEKFNLFRADGPEGWRLPNFDLILDGFARNFAISLSNRFQRSVNVNLDSMESMPFEALLQKLSGHGAIGILQLEPLNGGGLVIFDEQISFSLVEIVLGGSSDTEVVVPNRAMTAIELNVIREVIASACPELDKGFVQFQELKSALVKVVSNLRLLNFVALEAGVAVACFHISIDSLEGNITLVLPHKGLEPLQKKQQEKAIPTSTQQNIKWRKVVCDEVEQMEVELEALLANLSLRVRDILNFQVGDVIELACSPDTPLRVMVEGRAKYYGMAGVQGGKKAIRIMGRIPNGG
jgi:flagellar motor switch protein FliM